MTCRILKLLGTNVHQDEMACHAQDPCDVSVAQRQGCKNPPACTHWLVLVTKGQVMNHTCLIDRASESTELKTFTNDGNCHPVVINHTFFLPRSIPGLRVIERISKFPIFLSKKNRNLLRLHHIAKGDNPYSYM